MAQVNDIPEFTEETFDNEVLTSDIKKKTTEELADQIIHALFGQPKPDEDLINDIIQTSHENIVLTNPKQMIIKGYNDYNVRCFYGTPRFKDELERVD